MASKWENETHVSKEIGGGEKESKKQLREYCNFILEDNTKRLEDNRTVTIIRTLEAPCCKFWNENRFCFNPYISDSFRSIMNECEIFFRRTDSFVARVRMTSSDYDLFFFSPN